VQDHQNNDDDRHQNLLTNGVLERSERFRNQPGAVIERFDRYLADSTIIEGLLGEARRDLGNLFLYPFDHRQRVLAVARYHDTTHSLGSRLVQGTAAESRTIFDFGYLIEGDGHILALGDDGLAQVVEVLDETETANDVFDAIDLDRACADIKVAPAHGIEDLVQRNVECAQGVGVDVDLILAHVTADRSNFGDAVDAL